MPIPEKGENRSLLTSSFLQGRIRADGDDLASATALAV